MDMDIFGMHWFELLDCILEHLKNVFLCQLPELNGYAILHLN